MSELISKTRIYNYIKAEINPYGKPFEGSAYELGLKIMDFIENMETFEAAPVMHGEWEKTRLAGEYQCSNCHSVEYEYLTKSGFKLHGFCPNCGAKMDKGGSTDV